MAQPAATLKHTPLKGSPGSGTSEGGPTNAATQRLTKRGSMYCGVMDSRPQNSDRRQSAK